MFLHFFFLIVFQMKYSNKDYLYQQYLWIQTLIQNEKKNTERKKKCFVLLLTRKQSVCEYLQVFSQLRLLSDPDLPQSFFVYLYQDDYIVRKDPHREHSKQHTIKKEPTFIKLIVVFFSLPWLDNNMIEKQDDLYPLMFDIQLAYAFQDVEKSHNPKIKSALFFLKKKIQICVIREREKIFRHSLSEL